MDESDDVKRFSEGEVVVWIEQQSSIHIKAMDSHGDPVELTEEEAEDLGKALIQMSKKLRS